MFVIPPTASAAGVLVVAVLPENRISAAERFLLLFIILGDTYRYQKRILKIIDVRSTAADP